MNLWLKFNYLKLHSQIEDIDQNIRILKKGGWQAKIHSVLCLWWPIRGSIDAHVQFLEELKWKKIKLIHAIDAEFDKIENKK